MDIVERKSHEDSTSFEEERPLTKFVVRESLAVRAESGRLRALSVRGAENGREILVVLIEHSRTSLLALLLDGLNGRTIRGGGAPEGRGLPCPESTERLTGALGEPM